MDYLQILQKQKEEALALFDKNKGIAKDFMLKNNISRVVIEFDGNGDSGQVDSVSFQDENEEDTDVNHTPCQMFERTTRWFGEEHSRELVEVTSNAEALFIEMAYSMLEAKHSGWEINEGSFGTIIIKADGTGEMEYNERVEAVNTSVDLF